MDPNKKHVSRFEALPKDIIGVILTKIGASSPVDFHNTIRSCKEIHGAADTRHVYRSLSLAPLVKKPLAAIAYKKTMAKGLAHDKPEAYFIKGFLEYLHERDSVTGLSHLCIATDLEHKPAIYIYGVLLLCNGMTHHGKLYLAQLKWAEDTTTVDKASLHGISIPVRRRYLRNIRKMRPTNSCNLNDMENTCDKCFYYKRMKKFVYMM